MKNLELFNSLRLPGRLDTEQTATLLGFRLEPDIQVLMRAKLLKALGHPAQNGIKYFSSVEVLQLAGDPEWLHKATATIQKFWRVKHTKSANPQRGEVPPISHSINA
jgi:hypothetical protein